MSPDSRAQTSPRAAASTASSDSISVGPPLLLGGIDVSATSVAFSLAGDLWVVDRKGGRARAVTSGPWEDEGPIFSPDGSRIAFTRLDGGGNADVWIVSTAGGEAEQVTCSSQDDVVREWVGGWLPSPDVRAGRRPSFHGSTRVRRPAGSDGVALPSGYTRVPGADGTRLVYHHIRSLRDERVAVLPGGMTSRSDRGLATSRVVDRIPRANENLRHPMWHEDRIYYTSDASGVMNLQVYDPRSRRASALTQYSDLGIEFAGLGNDAIAFTRAGRIYLFDLRTQSEREVPVTLRMPAAGRARRETLLASFLQSAKPSPAGDRLVLESRGDIFVMDRESGDIRNLTQTPA